MGVIYEQWYVLLMSNAMGIFISNAMYYLRGMILVIDG